MGPWALLVWYSWNKGDTNTYVPSFICANDLAVIAYGICLYNDTQ